MNQWSQGCSFAGSSSLRYEVRHGTCEQNVSNFRLSYCLRQMLPSSTFPITCATKPIQNKGGAQTEVVVDKQVTFTFKLLNLYLWIYESVIDSGTNRRHESDLYTVFHIFT
jgi:hypothetical protein